MNKYIRDPLFNQEANLMKPLSVFPIAASVLLVVLAFAAGCTGSPHPGSTPDLTPEPTPDLTADPIIGAWNFDVNGKDAGKPYIETTISFNPSGKFHENTMYHNIAGSAAPRSLAPTDGTWKPLGDGRYILTVTDRNITQEWMYSSSQDTIFNVNDKDQIFLRENAPVK
jgi:hypothetical protein